jgi:IS4 transposase
MGMIETVLILVVVFWLGYQTAARFHRNIFREILKELGVTERQLNDLMLRQQQQLASLTPQEPTADLAVVDVKLEQVGAAIYAYRKSDDQFLAQGSDADTLIERLNQNLTPCRVVVAKEDGADLLQKSHT